ncbi:unnamed protein product [Adineta steineri]|uniref:Uncharacterized protein n=1 Tax=Adineta steineri TaxID=433720 RepID=A0A815NK54_9BILA|nr:unnamed protein product [Adineta steineri]CAF1434928.1 unnamed protein product [Adineta steineri]
MNELDNKTTTTILTDHHTEESVYDDNKDIIWPTVVGIFVALALGWMICRYKCSSNDRSPHIVRCCPKSLCKRIRLCCICIFSSCRFKNDSQQPQQQRSTSDLRMTINRGRPSNTSVVEIPFIVNNTNNNQSLNTQTLPQWPPPFLLNNNNQGPSLPLSITIQSPINSSEPKRHPLRRESLLPEAEQSNERRDSSPWPFQTTNMVFHNQTNEIKKSHLFFNT